jgi:hypothetical protein
VEPTNEQTPSGMACPDCHALVADMAAHKQWHSRLVSDLASAVEKEIKRSRSVSG